MFRCKIIFNNGPVGATHFLNQHRYFCRGNPRGRPSKINIDVSVGAPPRGRPSKINIDVSLRRAATGSRPYNFLRHSLTRFEIMQNSFPINDPLAAAHSEKLKSYVLERIKKQNPLNFAEFMDLALYAPGLGYYVAGAHKLGKGGDFVTAPELSAVFSRCLAHQCAQVINEIPGADILELGAGSGRMALDLLIELEALNALPQHYFILELSPDLQERQRALLAGKAPRFLERVQWLAQLPTIKGLILANEVLDAMPVRRFKQDAKLLEYFVAEHDAQLQWQLQSASPELHEACQALELEFAPGYESEINLQLPAFMQSLADSLERGLILLIDYGFPRQEYYHPERSLGTLMCHYQHQAHEDPLILLGIQDITAHVDFSAVAEAAHKAGLELAGFLNQASFLINCGLSELAQALSPNELLAVKQLVLPSEMGELFKVIGFTRQLEIPLQGFCEHDQQYRL